MKRFLNTIFFGMMVFGSSYLWAMDSGIEYTSQDLSIVNAIKRQSNITQYDVDKYKLLFLGGFAPLTALGTSGYAAYRAGQKAYTVASNNPDMIKDAFASTWMPSSLKDYMPSESTQGWMTNKVLWAGVAAGGVMYGMYPVLYSRTKEGILGKIQKFDNVCSRLSVANRIYTSLDELQVNIPSSWSGKSEIAQYLALDNLFDQGGYAIDLLEQVAHWGIDVIKWQNRIADFNKNLMANKNLLQSDFDRLIRARWDQQSGQLKIQDARSKVTGQHIKNVTTVWKTLKDITTSSANAVTYVYKHKEPIVGTAVGAYLYSKYQGAFGK
jgi:hypothetical protein